MVAFLATARTALYATATLFSLLTFVLAAASIGVSKKDFKLYIHASAELIAAGILGLFLLPVLHFLRHPQSTSFLSSVAVELCVLFVLWPLFLGGAAKLADQSKLLNLATEVENFQGQHNAFVPLTKAVETFGFLSWIVTFALFALVLVVAVTNQLRGDKGVWTSPLTFGGTPAADTEKGEAAPAAAASTSPAAAPTTSAAAPAADGAPAPAQAAIASKAEKAKVEEPIAAPVGATPEAQV